MLNFKSEREEHIKGRGKVFVVKNPIRSDEWAWTDNYNFLTGFIVKIDGKQCKINYVEHYSHEMPRGKNDSIGLFVTELDA